jgi:hypothetical protein
LRGDLLFVSAFAILVAPAYGFAESPPSYVGAIAPPRETSIALGYEILGAFKQPLIFPAARGAPVTGALEGLRLQVSHRPFGFLQWGAFAWTTGGTDDGRGDYVHELSRFAGTVRFVPWGFTRFEPWLGAELGIAVADDRASWNDPQTGKHAVSLSRVGWDEGVSAGLRVRLGELVALGGQGGVSFLGFTRPDAVVHEAGDTGRYFIRPADYGRRLWYSVGLTLELYARD